jgi:type IV secretory pathway VirB2 component (pilin)
MRNKTLLVASLMVTAHPVNVFAHTGEHHGNWLSNLVHFITNPTHLPMIIPAVIALGLAIHGIRKYVF